MVPKLPRRPRPHVWRFRLRRAMFVLPNLFTLASIFCGFYAMVLVSDNPGAEQFYQATLAVFLGVFFDMADGRVARMTRTQSDFGVQMDSLADVITFGITPAMLVYRWILWQLGFLGVLIAFTYTACGAIRLARFNVLAAHSDSTSSLHKKFFIGLPIPVGALVLISFIMHQQTLYQEPMIEPQAMVMLLFFIAYLMISRIRYRTFKDVSLHGANTWLLIGFLAAFVLLAVVYEVSFALMTFTTLYTASGLIEEIVSAYYLSKKRSAPPIDPAS